MHSAILPRQGRPNLIMHTRPCSACWHTELASRQHNTNYSGWGIEWSLIVSTEAVEIELCMPRGLQWNLSKDYLCPETTSLYRPLGLVPKSPLLLILTSVLYKDHLVWSLKDPLLLSLTSVQRPPLYKGHLVGSQKLIGFDLCTL